MALPEFKPGTRDAALILKSYRPVGSVGQALAAATASISPPGQALHSLNHGMALAKELSEEQKSAVRHFHEGEGGTDSYKLPDVTYSHNLQLDKLVVREKDFCCFTCGKRGAKQALCDRCKHVSYCSRECQLAHWHEHRGFCKTISNTISHEYGNEKSTRTFALKAFFRTTLQDMKRPHAVKFWLAVIIRNLHTSDPTVAVQVMAIAIWYVWHFTGAAVPKPLRKQLVDAAAAYSMKARKPKGKGWAWQSMPGNLAVAKQNFTIMLTAQAGNFDWMMSTDAHLRPHMSATALAGVPQGNLLKGLQGELLNVILQHSTSTPLGTSADFSSSEPTLAVYTSLRGTGLLTSPLGALVEQDASEAVIDALLTEAPVDTLENTLLLGCRAAPAHKLAPPGSIDGREAEEALRQNKGIPASERCSPYDGHGTPGMPAVQAEAIKMWRKAGATAAQPQLPAMRVLHAHALPAQVGAPWTYYLGRPAPASALSEATKQELRNLGGAYARLLKAFNKQRHRFDGDIRQPVFCVPVARQFDAKSFECSMSEEQLFSAAFNGSSC